jgi:trans-2,3-dihydro-3-hydroxyanthranilate isomerase
MGLSFHTLDVFTTTRFGGNPLAVVLDADALDTATMQTVAREFNLSETVFVLKPDHPAHTARVRIFTPTAEMPFAGHPTVGTAALLAELRSPGVSGEQDAIIVLEEKIGPVRVGVKLRGGSATLAEFDAPRLPEEEGRAPSPDRLASALGLIESEIGFENHRPTRYTAGNAFIFVPVATLDAIAKAHIASSHWASVFAGENAVGVFLYTRQVAHTTSAFHARMFAPHHGVAEDPATGSAAAAFAGVIHRFDEPTEGVHRRVIEQGFEMGRPSLITVSLTVGQGRLGAVRIAGHAVRVSQGTIEI